MKALSRWVGLIGLVVASASVSADAATFVELSPVPIQRFVDNAGNACAGCQLFVYAAGTTTPITTYTDSTGNTQQTNPIVLNSRGEPENISGVSLGIWVPPGVSYKLVFAPANDTSPPSNPFWTLDGVVVPIPITGSSSSTVGNVVTEGNTSGTNLVDSGTALSSLAPLASPALTGTPTAPTAASNTNTTQIATTAFVQTAVGGVAKPLLAKGNSAQTSSYTAVNSDDGTTIYLNSAGVGGKSLTVNALSTYTDTQYSVGFCNTDTRRWTISSADAGSLRLYPGQCNVLQPNGSVLAYQLPFQRYRQTTLNVGPSGSCSNGNDGLTSSSKICSFNTAFALIQSDFDTGGSVGEVIPSAGTYTENVFFAGYVVGGGDQISIDPSGTITILNGGSGAAVGTRDGGVLTLNGGTNIFELGCAGGVGAEATQFATIDAISVKVGTCSSGNMFSASDTGHVNVSGTTTVDGNFTAIFSVSAGGEITIAGTINFPSAVVGSFIEDATTTGVISYEGGPLTWQNTGNLTAQSYVIQAAGGIASGGDYVNIPGTTGSTTTPGWVQ